MAWAETDRQDRQRFDSIGRTVLQTVAPKTVRPLRYRTAVLFVCLFVCRSVTLLYCGQMVGWITIKLGMQVGLGPGHVVLDGNPAPLPQRGRKWSPQIFGPYLLWPNGWMDQHDTWHGGRPQPRRLRVRWGPRSPPQKGGGAPKFSAHVYCVKSAGWIKMILGVEVGLSPGDFVLDEDPAPLPKRGGAPFPNFRPISIVAKRLDASRCHLVWRLSLIHI